MKFSNLSNHNRGWFIGDFDSSLLKTNLFEVALIKCPMGIHAKHHHKIATEYNVLVEGKLKIGDIILGKNDIYIIEPGESTEQEFLENSLVLCVKTPSIPSDKYLD